MTHPQKILVIKHGAFGDLINATGAFNVIRRHHAQDHITLLTAPPYETIAGQMGFFDAVQIDPRAGGPLKIIGFAQSLGRNRFCRVYDLQNSDRTHLYYQIMRLYGSPQWSGTAMGCSHPQAKKDRHGVHAHDRFARQLTRAGIPLKTCTLPPCLDWLSGDISGFSLPPRPILLFPGSSKQGMAKRWPPSAFAHLTVSLEQTGYTPLLMGGPDDGDVCEIIQNLRQTLSRPPLINWQGRTSLMQVGLLARAAAGLIGNDTGPVQLGAGTETKTLVLWSGASDPDIYGPRGRHVRICYRSNLRDLDPENVMGQFNDLMNEKE